MNITPETLIIALAGLATAICSGVVGLLGAIAALIVAWRKSRADSRKEAAQVALDEKRGELFIRKDEMDLLRSELQRQYSVIAKGEERVRLVEEDNNRLRGELNALRDSSAEITRQLDAAKDEIKSQAARSVETDAVIRFLIDQNRLMRRAMIAARIPLPMMKRKGDEAMLDRLAPDLMLDVDPPGTSGIATSPPGAA